MGIRTLLRNKRLPRFRRASSSSSSSSGYSSDSSSEDEPEIDPQAPFAPIFAEDGDADGYDEEEIAGLHEQLIIPATPNVDNSEKTIPPDIPRGLTEDEVLDRRRIHGYNRHRTFREGVPSLPLGRYRSLIQTCVMTAALASSGFTNWVEASSLCVILLAHAAACLYQDLWSERILCSKDDDAGATDEVIVVRDGVLKQVQVQELVPDDIVRITGPSAVRADGRIITEGVEVRVEDGVINDLADNVVKRHNDMLHAMSIVESGQIYMVVTATGENTVFRRSALEAAQKTQTPLMGLITNIHTVMFFTVSTMLFLLSTVWLYHSIPTVKLVTLSLVLVMGWSPLSLAAGVVTNIASGLERLTDSHTEVRKLTAIERLSQIDTLCTDMSGVFTHNKLVLHEAQPAEGVTSEELFLHAYLAIQRKKTEMTPLDKTLLKELSQSPHMRTKFAEYTLKEFTSRTAPYHPLSNSVIAILESKQKEILTCIRGSPLFVLKAVNKENQANDEVRSTLKANATSLGFRGFGCLAVARRKGNGPWELLGLITCYDSLRHGTISAVKDAKALDINLKAVTRHSGLAVRNLATASGLGSHVRDARSMGLACPPFALPPKPCWDPILLCKVATGCLPWHTKKIVRVLQENEHRVAVTGIGLKDARVLRQGDVSIAAHGAKKGAKLHSDIMMTANGLGPIVGAISISRQALRRTYIYVTYRLSLSIHMIVYQGFIMAMFDRSLDPRLSCCAAAFSEILASVAALDKSRVSSDPVKWTPRMIWLLSAGLGLLLAIGSGITHTTMSLTGRSQNGDHALGDMAESYGNPDDVVFLQATLVQSWLIVILRSNGPFWKTMLSKRILGTIVAVDLLATGLCLCGIFGGSQPTHLLTVIRVWIFSFHEFCVIGGIYYILPRLLKAKQTEKKKT